MQNRKLLAGMVAAGAVVAGTIAMTAPGNAATAAHRDADGQHRHHHGTVVDGRLNTLNNSGVTGHGMITVEGRKMFVRYDASKLAPGLPHAAHIHYGAQARHECPTYRDDTNHDFRLNVAEGLPEYGPIAKSLTTRGDTSPASALAVDRFPTAPKGVVHYRRLITTDKAVARAVRMGEGVLVVHGVDYNNNGKYDFAGAGPSELNPKLPAEATDPAVCGVLR
jgi:hypothetical protein